ncbi:MAG: 2-phospho-L-lactate transferase, partial [Pseudonocardiales bacterium]|nr:2-phospho-L-lactate transferase [Pseudonocardiales bacterium]
AAYELEPSWFSLGDLDLATHLVRTQMLEAGFALSQITEALCARWLASDPRLHLVPMSDDRVETHVVIADPAEPSGRRAVHFQEYWVRLHAAPDALEVLLVGADEATLTPGLRATIAAADLILVAPSNPVVSIGPILAVAELRAALVAAPAPVIGFAGILGGAPVLGMAHRLLPSIGIEVDAAAVGLHYGARSTGGVLDTWVMDSADAHSVAAIEAAGLHGVATDLLMHDSEATGKFIRLAVETGVRRSDPA